MLSIIVAIANNMAIGHNNDLLCHLSDDLKHFKALTSGHPVIMGRRTFDSLPKKPLPKRQNIVLTTDTSFTYPGVDIVHSVGEALAIIPNDNETFIMGGATVYRQFLPYVDKLYITWIKKNFPADTFFPEVDFSKFQLLNETQPMTDPTNGIVYTYAEYSKR